MQIDITPQNERFEERGLGETAGGYYKSHYDLITSQI
jgi:hypothetical protein